MSFNDRVALLLTRAVGSMPCAYLFTLLAVVGFPWQGGPPSVYVQWVSQTLIQLVLLSVIMVGQNLIADKQQVKQDKVLSHISKQDDKLIGLANRLDAQEQKLLVQNNHLLTILKHLKKEGV